MHWARLAIQGANSIQLTYSYLGPIVSDFDEIKGNFGQFGGVLSNFELRTAAEGAAKLSNRKAVLKQNDGGFSIKQQHEAFRIIYKSGLRSKFSAL